VPELPEVETVRRGLAPVLEGARLVRVDVRRPDLRFPFPPDFAGRLKGRRVSALRRRAKYLVAELDDGIAWVSHLGMTGRWTIVGAAHQPGAMYYERSPNPAHTHVVVETEAGARLEFNDPRRFGYMDLAPLAEIDRHPMFAGLGPEPLGNGFSSAHLASVFAAKKTTVKAALLDQSVVAGLGNIYVCEALHRAGIAPSRAAGRIAPARLEALAREVRAVLEEAIAAGGSSIIDYAGTDGARGAFQERFRVYDREGEACTRLGCSGSVRRVVQAGRSSFYCPRCQR
jgi:formamidopyrimidine-DNA glycosylase